LTAKEKNASAAPAASLRKNEKENRRTLRAVYRRRSEASDGLRPHESAPEFPTYNCRFSTGASRAHFNA
jgi:hypothetical protein